MTTVTLPQPPAPPSTLPAQPPEQLSKQELRELVAPVALYPDVVLASLLPATTNPEQVHDAAQYVGQAQHVDRIPEDRGWDGSVVGLLQFPDVLRWLDANPAWTDEMGQAVTYQQADVLDAIQDYRRAVKDAGNLKSNQYQTVRAAPDRDIRIDPARPDVVYVPSYDPEVATQPQPPQPSPGINPWIVFGAGAVVGALGAWALYSIFDDDDDKVVVNNYYRGGGRRRIRGYDNYYYSRGRRPRQVDWVARQRARAARPEGWNKPRRLEHAAPSGQSVKRAAALRPPPTPAGGQPPRPAEVRREQKQANRQQREQQRLEQRQEKQQQRQTQQQQQQQRRAAQQEQRQQQRHERQDQQRQNRAQRQQHEQEQQQRQEEQRQQRQAQQRENREERQQRQQERQERHQEQLQQRQEQQRQQQEMRQERREQRQEERRENGGEAQKKKKKAPQQQPNP